MYAEFKASGFDRLSAQMGAMHGSAMKTGTALSTMGMHVNAVGVGVRNMGLKIFAAGAAIVGPLVYAAKSFAATGSRLWDLSARTGMAVESLSELDYAAGQSGTSLEGVERTIRTMSRSILGAADATEGTTGKLDHLGLSMKDLKGKTPIQQFYLIAERIGAISDPTMRAAAAMQVFGRSGTELLPMLAELGQLRREAKEGGLIWTTADAKLADQFGDSLSRMSRVIKSAWNAVGKAIIPVLDDLVNRISDTVKKVRDWISANPGLMVSLLKIGAIVAGVGAGLAILGMAIQTLAVPFAALAGVISLVSMAFSILIGILGFVTSPIGVIIIAVGALSGIILTETGVAGKAIDWLGEKFSGLANDSMSAFQGIKNALSAGDIGLAAQVVWATLKKWWTQGIFDLTNLWAAFQNGFIDMMNSLGPILLDIGGRLVDSMLVLGMAAAKALALGWLHGPVVEAMKADAERAKLGIAESTERGVYRIAKDIKAGKIGKEEGSVFLKDFVAGGRKAVAKVDIDLAKSIANLTGNTVGKELKDIWSVPLPPLDTKKFMDSLAGVDLTPKQRERLAAQQKKVDDATAELSTVLSTAMKWGPRSKGGTGWNMPGDAIAAAAAVPAAAEAVAAAGSEAKGGKFMGFEDVWKTLQSAVLGDDDTKRVQKDQLVVQKQMLKELQHPKPALAS